MWPFKQQPDARESAVLRHGPFDGMRACETAHETYQSALIARMSRVASYLYLWDRKRSEWKYERVFSKITEQRRVIDGPTIGEEFADEELLPRKWPRNNE